MSLSLGPDCYLLRGGDSVRKRLHPRTSQSRRTVPPSCTARPDCGETGGDPVIRRRLRQTQHSTLTTPPAVSSGPESSQSLSSCSSLSTWQDPRSSGLQMFKRFQTKQLRSQHFVSSVCLLGESAVLLLILTFQNVHYYTVVRLTHTDH